MIISILPFTFYIIYQVLIIILRLIRLVFLILFEIKCCLMELFEQPGCETPALNVMATRDQRPANVSKQWTLLADVDVIPPDGAA